MALPLIPLALLGGGFGAGLYARGKAADANAGIADTATSLSTVTKIAVLMVAAAGAYLLISKAKR